MDLIRGSSQKNYTSQKLVRQSIFSIPTCRNKELLTHTLWFMPSVAARAMKNLTMIEQHFYHDYEIIVCAEQKQKLVLRHLSLRKKIIDNPLKTKLLLCL